MTLCQSVMPCEDDLAPWQGSPGKLLGLQERPESAGIRLSRLGQRVGNTTQASGWPETSILYSAGESDLSSSPA